MKKLVLALIVAIALAPFSAFGLEMMTEESLKATTAQAGVVIALDDVVIVQRSQMDTMYIDDDGLDEVNNGEAAAQGAGLYIKDMGEAKRTIKINAIYTGSNFSNLVAANATLAGVEAASQAGDTAGVLLDGWGMTGGGVGYGLLRHKYNYTIHDGFLVNQALTIDIGNCPILSAGIQSVKTKVLGGMTLSDLTGILGYNAYKLGYYLHMNQADFAEASLYNVVGVNITLPTVEIEQIYEQHCKEIGVRLVQANAAGNGYDTVLRTTPTDSTYLNAKAEDHFIKIQKSGSSTLAIMSGKLEIAPK